jgi:hypothetical protein
MLANNNITILSKGSSPIESNASLYVKLFSVPIINNGEIKKQIKPIEI